MKTIPFDDIVRKVSALCHTAAHILPADVLAALKDAMATEQSATGKTLLAQCVDNAYIAREQNYPLCQDTGFAVYFVDLGAGVCIDGGLLTDAINAGTQRGYQEAYLRKSIVYDPLYQRKNTGSNTPAVIHVNCVAGDSLVITLAPKGGGSENMGAVAMLTPAAGEKGVIDFVVDTVVKAGGNPCPPVIVGVGIGGTMELCALLAKKALLRPLCSTHADEQYARLEKDILSRINASGVGPQGLGGSTTALGVHIECSACHIASMPVAVALNCHAARHARAEW